MNNKPKRLENLIFCSECKYFSVIKREIERNIWEEKDICLAIKDYEYDYKGFKEVYGDPAVLNQCNNCPYFEPKEEQEEPKVLYESKTGI